MLRARWLGRVPYGEADRLQRALHERATDDYLLLLEHPHVYTLGTTADPAHVLVEPATVGAELVHVDRGGDVTYHGPGQLVGYPIIDLKPDRQDVHRYVRDLEEVLIRTAADFGLEAGRIKGYSGAWVGDRKLAAIGVRIARWVTSHGFALNVTTDLAGFDLIVPCGITDRGVTSLSALLGRDVTMPEVEAAVVTHFAAVFERDLA
jgi:lipoate-protein ligase B